MNFLEESQKLQEIKNMGKVNLLLASLDESEKQSLLDALNDLGISSRVISRILNDNGYKIGRAAVDKWRHENVKGYYTRSNHYMGDFK